MKLGKNMADELFPPLNKLSSDCINTVFYGCKQEKKMIVWRLIREPVNVIIIEFNIENLVV